MTIWAYTHTHILWVRDGEERMVDAKFSNLQLFV